MKKQAAVRQRDEWSTLADFLGNMIMKYADDMDLDHLPDPEITLLLRSMRDTYAYYLRRNMIIRHKDIHCNSTSPKFTMDIPLI